MPEYPVTKIQFEAPCKVAVVTKAMDFALGAHDVLLKTSASLVSTGTELAKLTGLQRVAYPFDPGNRAAGEVVAVGDAVQDVAVGDRVVSYTPHWSHALTHRLRVKVPDEVEDLHAPFAGMASVGMTALRVGEVELGDWVVVLGMGLVGNLTAQLCQSAGAQVVTVDLSEARLRLASRCGLDNHIDASQGKVQEQVLAATQGQEPDVVVEASGTPEGAALAVTLTGRRGAANVVLLGSPRRSMDTDITPFLNRVHLWRNGTVNLKGAHEWRYPLHRDPFHKHSIERNMHIVLRLMARQQLALNPLISQVARPREAAEAFAAMSAHPDGMVGVLFDWRAHPTAGP